MGLAPHSAAKDALLRMRWGLSPAVTSSAAATSGPTPQAPSRAGLACSQSSSSSASSWAISPVRAWWRRARDRRAVLAAAVTWSGLRSGRQRVHVSTSEAVPCPARRSLRCSPAVTIRPAVWLAAWVRDLTAERRATESILIASTGPSADFGTAAAWPLSAARAAASASTASVLPRRRRVWRFGRLALDRVDVGGCEMAGEAGAVRAGALNADARDTAVRAEPAQQICVAVGVGCELSGVQQPPGGVDRCGDMDVLVGAGPRRISRFGPVS